MGGKVKRLFSAILLEKERASKSSSTHGFSNSYYPIRICLMNSQRIILMMFCFFWFCFCLSKIDLRPWLNRWSPAYIPPIASLVFIFIASINRQTSARDLQAPKDAQPTRYLVQSQVSKANAPFRPLWGMPFPIAPPSPAKISCCTSVGMAEHSRAIDLVARGWNFICCT